MSIKSVQPHISLPEPGTVKVGKAPKPGHAPSVKSATKGATLGGKLPKRFPYQLGG